MRARASRERPATSSPSSRYRPAVGVSRQPRTFMNVDLPEPDGPHHPHASPRPAAATAARSARVVRLVVESALLGREDLADARTGGFSDSLPLRPALTVGGAGQPTELGAGLLEDRVELALLV